MCQQQCRRWNFTSGPPSCSSSSPVLDQVDGQQRALGVQRRCTRGQRSAHTVSEACRGTRERRRNTPAIPCLRSGVHSQSDARDHGPGDSQTKPNQTPSPRGRGALRASECLILAGVNALSIPFSGRGPSPPIPGIGTSRLQQANSVHNGQAVSTWGRQCRQTIDRLAPILCTTNPYHAMARCARRRGQPPHPP